MNGTRFGCVVAFSLLVPSLVGAQETVEFGGGTWTRAGEARVAEVDGRDVLEFRTGRLVFADADFGNGSIEFDFRTSGHRSFVGLGFRAEPGSRDFEYFYIRPHQTGRFDAMQYTPVDHGLTAWQIYAEHNAMAWFTPNEWTRVRLDVHDSRLRVYVGGHSEPALDVETMIRDPQAGGLVLVANFPEQDELDLYPNAIANLEVTRTNADPVVQSGEPMGNGSPTMVQRWDVSAAFPSPAPPVAELPGEILGGDWESIWTHDARGRLNIGRSRALVQGEHGTAVLARTVIRSERDQVKKLNFGYSDRGSVFLNGQLVFTSDNTYLSRSERYLGVMTIENDALYLPLREGDNELIFVVTEAFGGWGVVARLEDLNGVELSRSTP